MMMERGYRWQCPGEPELTRAAFKRTPDAHAHCTLKLKVTCELLTLVEWCNVLEDLYTVRVTYGNLKRWCVRLEFNIALFTFRLSL